MGRLKTKYNAIALDEPVQIVEVGPVAGNPMLTEVVVKIAYHGFNRNGSYISKETMENMIRRSLPLTPLVGNYIEKKKDFGGHDSHIEIDTEKFEIKEVRDTRVYGVVGEQPEVYWQKIVEKDGRIKEYIVTNAYLFTSRFEEAKRILENSNWQSMEIDEKTVIGDFEEVPGAPWDIQQKNDGMVFNIKEANLIGLCILGADIEPAFESSDIRAVFSLFSKQKEENEKGDFMDKLKLALQYNFDDAAYDKAVSTNGVTRKIDEFEDEAGVGLTVADVDTEQEVEDIKGAINRLDEAADAELNPESQSAIDEAIDTMLQVEQELDIEDQLIPISDKAKEVDNTMPGGMKDILSSPTFEKVDPLNKPFKEEETMTDKEKELLAQQEAERQAQAQAQPAAQEPAPETAPTEPVAPQAPEQAPQAQTAEVNVQVEDDPVTIDPETGLPVEGQRKTAEEKRKEIELAKYGDEELLDILLSRVEMADLIKERLATLNQEVPEEGEETAPVAEEGAAPEAPAEFKKEDEEEDEDNLNETPDTEDADTEDNDDAEGEPAPAQEPTPEEDEEEKKKKKNIQHFELENAKLALDYSNLQKEFTTLQEETKALREFKLAIENKEKEEVLSQFSLLDDAVKEEFRLNFSAMSKEDLEAKCALAYYRKGLMAQQGQDSSATDAVVSYNLEDKSADNLPGWVKALKSSKK